MAVAARFFAQEQTALLIDVADADCAKIRDVDEVWVHSCWKPSVWRVCRLVLKERRRLVRMVHGNLDPVRLRYHGWKKWLAGPIERFFLRRADVVVATCQAEAEWIRKYEPRVKKIEVTDVKRFFDLNHETHEMHERVEGRSLHLLYLGRRHPLKGVEYLEEAVAQLTRSPLVRRSLGEGGFPVPRSLQLKIVSNAFGEEKEKVWEWCDVLVLPTLSENFGLVVAEALERGKRVITTDGAPAWGGDSLEFRVQSLEFGGEIWSGYGGRLIYLKGYRDGTSECRIELLKRAIESLVK